MRMTRTLALAAALIPAALASGTVRADISTDTVRQRAEQACYDDVQRLCNDAIPDEEKIKACMKVNRKSLSAGCRKVFDSYVK